MSRLSVADKRRVSHPMHQGGCFVIPNPWDVGSALRTARLIADQGSFASFADAAAGRDLKGFFRNDRDRRGSE